MMARKIKIQKFNGGSDMQDTAELFIHVLCTAIPTGQQSFMDYKEMMLNAPIVEKIKSCDGHFILSTAEWEVLSNRLKVWRWTQMTDDLLAAYSAVLDAKEVELKEVTKDAPD